MDRTIDEPVVLGAAPEPEARAPARRLWMWIGGLAAIGYATTILIVATLAPDLGFFTYQGGRVLGIDRGSPVAEAGLQVGDDVVSIDGVTFPTAYDRFEAMQAIRPGDTVVLGVERDGASIGTVSYVASRALPLGSAAGIALGLLLLAIALLADRGGADERPRWFFRQTLCYVVFLAGCFSIGTALRWWPLAVPWIFAMVLAAPMTCRFMLMFPAGRTGFSRRELAWLYGPPLALGAAFTARHLGFMIGRTVIGNDAWTLASGLAAGGMAAVYLCIGAVARSRRLRRQRDQIDPVAARWLQLAGVAMAVPMLLALVWAIHDMGGFVSGGFRPFVAVAMVSGSAGVVLAMTRTPFGELDRVWRRSGGYLLATGMAATLYLALIAVLGGAASVLSGGDFQAALAATLGAAVVFGPLRAYLQKFVDERFGRDRTRARALLREAAHAAAATLDVDALQEGVCCRVRTALGAGGCAIWVADGDGGAWLRVALAGELPLLPARLDGGRAQRRFERARSARAARDIDDTMLALPVPAGDGHPAMLVVGRTGLRFDEEERELLATVAAQLEVALANARRHRRLQEMAERLQREVDVAERRRREIARLKERVEEENRALIGELASRSGRAPVIGVGLGPTFELAQKVAHSDASVLVRGETGVGKELVARAIHAASARRHGPFIVVDCGAIAKGVFESGLFGHERGAFTGAVRAAQGAFRAADGGTIFLDEIGELPIDLQPKLLRVLQEREVHPVGADKPIKVDVRVLAATHRDLAVMVHEGRFRADLYYRLAVIRVPVPPLRERREDIPFLASAFVKDVLGDFRAKIPQATLEAIFEGLRHHDWPGNVRELRNVVERAAILADPRLIHGGALDAVTE
ncbi:MAG TPA: sigma 54-interacting transcriptional regulator, partial [Kofleriaceae bacterium]|nr:sigma 54-interacting transcriptional regulator [Kofleriaceae bacterium]